MHISRKQTSWHRYCSHFDIQIYSALTLRCNGFNVAISIQALDLHLTCVACMRSKMNRIILLKSHDPAKDSEKPIGIGNLMWANATQSHSMRVTWHQHLKQFHFDYS